MHVISSCHWLSRSSLGTSTSGTSPRPRLSWIAHSAVKVLPLPVACSRDASPGHAVPRLQALLLGEGGGARVPSL